MGPKKKPQKGNQQGGPVKMTRKEKALAKKIERERWKEVTRRMEQERLQKEVEAVAKANEEARIAKETHDAWVKAEEDRLTAERNSMKEFYDWRKAAIIRIEAEAKEASDVCSHPGKGIWKAPGYHMHQTKQLLTHSWT
ncbi:hypothetical protein Mapa_007387 [Marchantia paleacea]|nr:hypothetical protein Mapa_007387 [Marchantia paleacea]